MIGRILKPSKDFRAVEYNLEKVSLGKGDLLMTKNLPTYLTNNNYSVEDIKNYLRAFSNAKKDNRNKNTQFHVSISCKGREFSKEQFKDIGEKYMSKMGYSSQPYLMVFHTDTNNNHIHLVSTRINDKGNFINDSFEKYRSLSALREILKNDYSIDLATNEIEKLEALLSYNYTSENQLKHLLHTKGYSLSKESENYSFYKNSDKILTLSENEVKFNSVDSKRLDQLKALFIKYSNNHSTSLRPVYEKLAGDRDGKLIGYESDFSNFMRNKLGLEMVYHFADNKPPFGYTVLDHSKKNVLKGSDLMSLKQLISDRDIPKNTARMNNRKAYFINMNYNISSQNHINVLSRYFKIDENLLRVNDKRISNEELKYYKILFNSYLKNSDFKTLNKEFNITSVYLDNQLFFIDKSRNNIISSDSVLENDLKAELSYNNLHNEEKYLQHQKSIFDVSIEMADDQEPDRSKSNSKQRKRKK